MSQQKQTVSLDPGEAKTVPFTFTPSGPGIYNVNVGGLIGSFEAIALPPDIRVDSVRVTPATVNLGQVAKAYMTCTNYGGTTGEADIEVGIFQEGSGSTEVDTIELGPGETKEFTILSGVSLGDMAGHFIINAGDKSATLDVIGGNCGVTGIIKSSTTDAPIEGVTVMPAAMPERAVVTDADGKFIITGWDFTSIMLDVTRDGYISRSLQVTNLVSDQTSDIGVIKLTPTGASMMTVVRVSPPPKECYVGDVYPANEFLSASLTIRNVGNAIGYTSFDGRLNGASGQGGTVTLSPGQEATVQVGVSVDRPGNYVYEIVMGGIVVYTQDIVAMLGYLEVSLGSNPVPNARVGQSGSMSIVLNNPTSIDVRYNAWLKVYRPDGRYESAVYETDKVVVAGQEVTVPGSVLFNDVGEYHWVFEIGWGEDASRFTLEAYTSVSGPLEHTIELPPIYAPYKYWVVNDMGAIYRATKLLVSIRMGWQLNLPQSSIISVSEDNVSYTNIGQIDCLGHIDKQQEFILNPDVWWYIRYIKITSTQNPSLDYSQVTVTYIE